MTWSTSRGYGSTDSHGDVEDRMSGGRRNGKRRSKESTRSRSSRCSRREDYESDEDDDLESSASAEHEGQQREKRQGLHEFDAGGV